MSSALRDRLPGLVLRDQHRLQRRLDGVRRVRDDAARDAALAEIAAEVDVAERRVAARRASVPAIRYPEELPVSARRDEIAAAIRDHQVVVVAGETGSGKTTQLPKICLELGRGVAGLIGHTQPRRIAARTVAERIAAELDVPLGEAVGWKVRFTDQAGEATLVKLMTDGILLAEIQGDRMLRQYDTLIIDEAHERSLNVDFLLGYLTELLPRRPDLKVVITSATIDPERFARHFEAALGAPVPIVEVSGRTYPVEIRYRPIVDPDDAAADPDRDQTTAVLDAVDELAGEGRGDILVFLSGEREIRDTAEAITALELRDTEVVPLYARLSSAEQHRVFAPHRGRRIVLATNVAETSLTVPGIRYVIDPGTARISRYSHRLKVQRLPIEPVSQASANQRAGRCGRTSDGICIRLYTADDYDARPEFTDPEILRTNLASVVLQMAALNLGDIAKFGFVEPPDRRAIADGVALLQELNALVSGELSQGSTRHSQALTATGRTMSRLPVDPRLGRMVVEAQRGGCLAEVLVIVAALSIQDPRERPAEHQQAADAAHARFVDKGSDFVAHLNLWRYLAEQRQDLSSNKFRQRCKAEFLHYLRVREWQDLHSQLRRVVRETGLGEVGRDLPAGQTDSAHVHQALLAGLLSHLGLRDPEQRDYLGARGARFSVFPGSALFRKPPRWVMAAELVETSRVWGRVCASIEPEWIEPLAGHLVKRQHSEPHWERRRAGVVAAERVTLYGIPIVVGRKIDYGRIDPELSRELFIRHALVEGDWDTRHEFFHANRAMLDDVEELENRARRRDILVDDDTLFEFYDRRLPADLVSGRHFDSWWRKARRGEPDLLDFSASMLVSDQAGRVRGLDYPDEWPIGVGGPNELRLRLGYQFEPGTEADGVTVHVPLAVLNQVPTAPFSWQVPGLRAELVVALLKSLPKPLRRDLVPTPDHARAALARMTPYREPLLDALERALRDGAGVAVPREAWQLDRVPAHLLMTFRVVDGAGTALAEGKDLDALRRAVTPQLRATLSSAATGLERRGLRSWDVGEAPGHALPRTVTRTDAAGHRVTAHPALVDEGDSVAVQVFETPAEQARAMWPGTRRLLLLTVPSPVKDLSRRLDVRQKVMLGRNPHGSLPALLDDCVTCAADHLLARVGGPAWDGAGFARLQRAVRAELPAAVHTAVLAVERILSAQHAAESALAGVRAAGVGDSLADVRAQLAGLVHPGFVTAIGWDHLGDLPRYLDGVVRRLEKLPRDPVRDRAWTAQVHAVQAELEALRPKLSADDARRVRWMIEELRVSYFAQPLRTAFPVSDTRIYRTLDDLAS